MNKQNKRMKQFQVVRERFRFSSVFYSVNRFVCY